MVSVTIGSRAAVRRLVRLINSLPVAQPIVYMCPLEIDPRQITVTFRGQTGDTLAVLSYADFKPWSAPSGGCKTVQLTIGGRRQDALDGGSFIFPLQRIVGRRLI